MREIQRKKKLTKGEKELPNKKKEKKKKTCA